jgi:regulator of RNase E activity RraA
MRVTTQKDDSSLMHKMCTSELIERFAAIPYVCAISDILDELGLMNQVLPPEIQSICAGQSVAGQALTVVGEPTTSIDPAVIFVPYLRMLGEIRPGHVLVSRSNDSVAAHLGELSCETAHFLGARGAVIDGGVRDTAFIRKLGFPVFARYHTPRDIRGRWRMLDFNVPISIGAVSVSPGDYVVGDSDGVVVVPQGVAEEVIDRAEAVVATENLVRKDILRGVRPIEAFEKHGRF